MKTSKIALIFKVAPFSAVMTVVSFVLFIGVYYFITFRAIEPYYLEGLIFGVPSICFGIITFFTVKKKVKPTTSSTITVILIFLLSSAALFAFISMAFDAATTTTTDIGKYERVLNLRDYPSNSLINHFPNKIPSNAKKIVFRYNPAFLQGGERFDLKYETDLDTIRFYTDELTQKSKWQGKAEDGGAEKNGIFSGAFYTLGYSNLPEDFTIYLIDSRPYQPDNWNHGKISLVAISKQRNEIIFHAEDW